MAVSINPPLGPVVLDLAGPELLPEEAELLQHPQLGGLIFFRRNFESSAQLVQLVAQIRAVRPNILLAVDQEGGRVQRFKEEFTRLPPLQVLGVLFESDPVQALVAARQIGWLMAAEILVHGLDISFAPVVDADDCFSSVIGDRALAKDLQAVVKLGSAYIEGMNSAGMQATLKHFPGHGAIAADSHEQLPVDQRDFETVWHSDMVPFRALLAQAGAVMPAHILFPSVAPNPVGFSPFWLQNILRQQLQFSGVIFSDDLSMEGAAAVGDHRQRAEAALTAGCDAVLVCNQPRRAEEVVDHLNVIASLTPDRLTSMRAAPKIPMSGLHNLQQTQQWQDAKEWVDRLIAADGC